MEGIRAQSGEKWYFWKYYYKEHTGKWTIFMDIRVMQTLTIFCSSVRSFYKSSFNSTTLKLMTTAQKQCGCGNACILLEEEREGKLNNVKNCPYFPYLTNYTPQYLLS